MIFGCFAPIYKNGVFTAKRFDFDIEPLVLGQAAVIGPAQNGVAKNINAVRRRVACRGNAGPNLGYNGNNRHRFKRGRRK